MNRSLSLTVLGLACAAPKASAFEFQCRFIERVGNVDVVLPGNFIEVSDGLARRIRIQFGVFDDATGPAPAGGFVGWNVGSLCVDGCMGRPVPPPGNSDESIVGRIAPFTFAPGGPSGPFECESDIDATLGTQSPPWQCGPDGNPFPQPGPVVRGINTFVSVLEFTIDPAAGSIPYEVVATGNLIAASQWIVVGNATPPDCSDPANPIPGSVTYAPLITVPQAFECELFVNCPAPGAAVMLALGGMTVVRRRRR
ncbi:MAG: hypothetical protein H7210_00635 [Pyrinomonadaceae bacterium]|nr:hypothetical protein [Phycisphaerales bacterium]